MKANQAFQSNDEAVSPVIGVILMVAITVVLAAVVFVLVTKLSGNSTTNSENASATVSSNTAGTITVTLISQGQYGPYCTANTGGTPACAALDMQITVNGVACLANAGPITANGVTFADSNSDLHWAPGESFTISNKGCTSTANTLTSGATATVSVTVHKTVIQDNTPIVVR